MQNKQTNSDALEDHLLRDYRRRFVFEQLDARGCIVHLQETCESIQATHHYPPQLARLLNEFALAACLLRDSIKIEGSLTIQLRTPGVITLLMADCLSDRRVRAIAEYKSDELASENELSLNQLGEGAILAITISPDEGERYQSIVPIENASLEECLQDYFARSEQLPSLFRLLADKQSGLGIAVHALPPQKVKDATSAQEHLNRLAALLQTLDTDEALSLDAQALLTRLFHEESCRLFEAHSVEFGCECSHEKSLEAIRSLGAQDVQNLIAERQANGDDNLVVDCHFCFQRYEFDFDKLLAIL